MTEFMTMKRLMSELDELMYLEKITITKTITITKNIFEEEYETIELHLNKNEQYIGQTTTVYNTDENSCIINWLGIEQEYQGNGYGELLLFHTIEMIYNRYPSLHKIHLDDDSAYASNPKSIYHKFGFVKKILLESIDELPRVTRSATSRVKKTYEKDISPELVLFLDSPTYSIDIPYWDKQKYTIIKKIITRMKSKINNNHHNNVTTRQAKRLKNGGRKITKNKTKNITKNKTKNKKGTRTITSYRTKIEM